MCLKRKNKVKKEKPQKKVSNIMLVLICSMIILYTAADFALQYFAGIEVSPTLTNAWFAFWGTEIVALTAIKTAKVIKNQDKKPETSQPEDASDLNQEGDIE